MRSSILKLSLSALALLAGKASADASYNLKSHSLSPPYISKFHIIKLFDIIKQLFVQNIVQEY